MPNYNFLNEDTGEQFEMFFTSYRMKDDYLKDNPNVKQQIVSTPGIVSGVSGSKPDESFRDVLRNIDRRAGRNSKVNTW